MSDDAFRTAFVAFVEEHDGDGQLVARVPFFGESASEADEQAQMYILGNRCEPELQSAILPGGGLVGDYPSLAAQIPGLATAGAQIAAQLHAEGAAQGQSATDIQDRIGTAQNALAQTYSDITSSSSAFQLPIDGPGGALDVAQKYVTSAYTVVGAVDAVGGLAAAAASGDPAAIEQAGSVIVGTIVGLAAAAGAISAGVGAVIVAGVGLVIEGLTALFSHAPPAATVCGSELSQVPTIVVGCAFSMSATRRAPKSVNWRPFPEPTVAADAPWYAPPSVGGLQYFTSFTWRGDDWSGGFSSSPDRAIDRAFPDYQAIAQENTGSGTNPIDLFRAAFFVAWKANRAFALNGLTPQDDWQVLSYVTRTWNNAHAGSGSGGNSLLLPGNGHGTGADFESALVGQILNLSPGDPNLVGSRLKINLGPLKTPPRVAPTAAAASSPATSTAGKVAAVAGLAAVAGVGGWIALGGSPPAAWRGARRFLGL
jgi:hypothetical protein